MSSGWVFLAAMIVAYGVANLLQSVAAARTRRHDTFNPRLLLSLATHRTYILGITFQLLGFMLALLARRELPLFLVQSAVAAGLGVTTLLGIVLLQWRLPRGEMAMLALLGFGVAGLVMAAEPAPSRQVGMIGIAVLAGALLLISLGGVFGARLRGVPGSVALGALAGLAFGAAAIASRPLAGLPIKLFPQSPLLYLLVAHSIVGQLLLGLAMQRGSTTAAVAAMDASAAVPAAAVGLLLLGDRIIPGRVWLAAVGFVVTLGAVAGLTRHASPQQTRIDPTRFRWLSSRAAAVLGAPGPASRATIALARRELAPRAPRPHRVVGGTAVVRPGRGAAARGRGSGGSGRRVRREAPIGAGRPAVRLGEGHDRTVRAPSG